MHKPLGDNALTRGPLTNLKGGTVEIEYMCVRTHIGDKGRREGGVSSEYLLNRVEYTKATFGLCDVSAEDRSVFDAAAVNGVVTLPVQKRVRFQGLVCMAITGLPAIIALGLLHHLNGL